MVTICTTRFNIQKLHILPTHTVFMCFVWISEQTAIINWLVCITETECVYCAVRTGYLKIFMCSVWISEQTAIISQYNINWLICITEKVCVYYAVRTGSLTIIQVDHSLQNYSADLSRTFKTSVSQLSQFNPHANTEQFLSSGRPL